VSDEAERYTEALDKVKADLDELEVKWAGLPRPSRKRRGRSEHLALYSEIDQLRRRQLALEGELVDLKAIPLEKWKVELKLRWMCERVQ